MVYETTVEFTLEEYKKMCKEVFVRLSKGYLTVVVCSSLVFLIVAIMSIALGEITSGIIYLMGSLIVPLAVFVTHVYKVKKECNTNKSVQDAVIHFTFFEERFEVSRANGSLSYGYEQIYKVIETKDRFYIFVSQNQALPIVKEKCEEGLIALLRGLVK